MTERPILFGTPMVRAILAGAKSQTRRVAKPKRSIEPMTDECPFGQPGDRLWVRETFALVPRAAYRCSDGVQQTLRPDDDLDAAIYRAGWERSNGGLRWRPSIHMPRWASRITLEITDVRVERLQRISDADAFAEGLTRAPSGWWSGFEGSSSPTAIGAYGLLWESINGTGSWDANPWVWALSFRRVEVAAPGEPMYAAAARETEGEGA